MNQPNPTNQRRRQRRHQPKPHEVVVVLIFVTLLCLLGFILVAGLLSGNQTSPAHAYALQTQKAFIATPSATPFQPDGASDMVDATNNNSGDVTPDANDSVSPKLEKPEGQINILLLGSDVRPNDGGFRTDSIIWVSLNPQGEFVSAISFPRDLFINIPGMGENRINVAFPRGGFDLLADTFEVNFGVRPDHYVLIDFNGFKSIINNLGGIDVQTTQNLYDTCPKWINSSGYCSVGPGLVHMNGEVALWYARSRYASNDIDRAKRAQEVIEAIFRRLMSLDVILKAPDLYSAYTSYVQTDVSLSTVLKLLPLANQVYNNNDIRNYVIGFDQVYSWVTYQGAQVLLPYENRIQELLIEALTLE